MLLCQLNYYLFVTICWQNYFGDPWNVLDFVIVVGSITDIVAGRVLVSDETQATPSVGLAPGNALDI